MFFLEISTEYSGVIMRQQFNTRRRAENARRKLAKEMGKGKFRNDSDIVEIKGDAGTISVRASTVTFACVTDQVAWDDNSLAARNNFFARHPEEKPETA